MLLADAAALKVHLRAAQISVASRYLAYWAIQMRTYNCCSPLLHRCGRRDCPMIDGFRRAPPSNSVCNDDEAQRKASEENPILVLQASLDHEARCSRPQMLRCKSRCCCTLTIEASRSPAATVDSEYLGGRAKAVASGIDRNSIIYGDRNSACNSYALQI